MLSPAFNLSNMMPNLTGKPRLRLTNWHSCIESGQGTPADLDHAVRLYKLAAGLGTVAPETAQQASVAATKLINKMRQAEEP